MDSKRPRPTTAEEEGIELYPVALERLAHRFKDGSATRHDASRNFTRVEISREVYSPTAHVRIEADQQIIREGLARLFKGEISIPMDVKSFPVEAQAP